MIRALMDRDPLAARMMRDDRSPLTPIDWHNTSVGGVHFVTGAMREDLALVRPGDEVRIAWTEDGAERSCWARVVHPQRWVMGEGCAGWPALAGITTLGREVVAAHALVTDVRPELDEGVRASWAERYGRSCA